MKTTATEKDVIDQLERLFVLDHATTTAKTRAGGGNSFWSGVAITSCVALSIYLVTQNADGIQKYWQQATAAATKSIAVVVPPSSTNGLSATRTTITGVADSQSMTAAYYLSTVLHNSGSTNQEAQMQIILPAGAAVTRATLWVNGQPQEAAFADNVVAQQAFDWVQQGRRDPLLVKQLDARTIQITASPVVPFGDGMKIRIGITAPMRLLSNGQAAADLPTIGKRNFGDGSLDVHIESNNAISTDNQGTVSQTGATSVLRLNEKSLDTKLAPFSIARPGGISTFATRLTHSVNGQYVVARLDANADPGSPNMTLTRQSTRPTGEVISNVGAAARLSTLWAHQEIERFVQEGDNGTALQIAHAYRVVSPVSSAVVLENGGDYQRFGLDRNQWASIKHADKARRQVRGTLARIASDDIGAEDSSFAPRPTSAPAPAAPQMAGAGGNTMDEFANKESQPELLSVAVPSPEGLQGATNGTISGVNSAGTVQTHPTLLGLPVGFGSAVAVVAVGLPMLLLGALAWLPVALLLFRSLVRLSRRQGGAGKLALLAVAWSAVAVVSPLASQILAVCVGALLLRRRQVMRSS